MLNFIYLFLFYLQEEKIVKFTVESAKQRGQSVENVFIVIIVRKLLP